MDKDRLERFKNRVDESARAELFDRKLLPAEEEVRKCYEDLAMAFHSSLYADVDADLNLIVGELSEKYITEQSVSKKFGFAYCDDETKPWLRSLDEEPDWFFWERYKKLLINDKKWEVQVVQSLEHDTFEILDLMANPKQSKPFERRGLVMASVQSGKTSNYAGLICRAADVGFKIIIVMAGVHNALRNQTQARLEEGFTGLNIDNDQEMIGVSKYGKAHRPVCCTSRVRDFNKRTAETLKGMQSSHTEEPWFFVIKKNSSALRQITEWLERNCKADDPLLLIDDEADNASINGKYKRELRGKSEVTKINSQIRSILQLFNKKVYLGYTATPYANILIDPDAISDEFGKDIFPRSFIYTLEESPAYFGVQKAFKGFDTSHPEHLRFIYDIDSCLPAKHKSDTSVSTIPRSLKDAVQTFVLASVVRVLRGEAAEHTTMMINVSPYVKPQNDVAFLVNDYLKELKDAVKAYGAMPVEVALASSQTLAEMKANWDYEYSKTSGFIWSDIQPLLYATLWQIHTVRINSKTEEKLDYEHGTEHVIAIGGYRLSRGLTLEGLVVSYYSRNAKAYDALMQMARWFGYRPNYEDLCRIWMSEKTAEWYDFIAESTEELVDELRWMRSADRTPANFGLHIRQSPDSLIVTARNKMGTGQIVPANPTNLNKQFVETTAFKRDPASRHHNLEAAEQLVSSIKSSGATIIERRRGCLVTGVSPSLIRLFLRAFINEDAKSPTTKTDYILDYMHQREADRELTSWDVYFAEGRSDERFDTPAGLISREFRTPSEDTRVDVLVNRKRRLSSRGIEKIGLTDKQVKEAERNYRELKKIDEVKNYPDYCYREFRERPLLVIHPVLFGFEDDDAELYENLFGKRKKTWPSPDYKEEAIGWSISFPYTSKHVEPVDYVFNEVALSEIGADFEDEPSDDDYEDNDE